MSYLNFKKMNNKAAAEISLARIIQFVPRKENGISNFAGANHLVTAWALGEKNGTGKANEWLDEQMKKFSGNKSILWAKETFNNNSSAKIDSTDGTARLLKRLINYRNQKIE